VVVLLVPLALNALRVPAGREHVGESALRALHHLWRSAYRSLVLIPFSVRV
jgi:hypothetical protein